MESVTPQLSSDDEPRWIECDDGLGEVIGFPGERLRRFVAVQMVQPGRWRAAVFIGWHLDPHIKPDRRLSSYAEAISRADKGARGLGLPRVSDRYSVLGRGVWSASA